ncbi:MAG: PD-(D/E)XK nuclease family protein [Defluviitaleaceae bacterium]|nr:PD-(D/E)XK nuclease family protein [Defluviitaleaceae bacterium]
MSLQYIFGGSGAGKTRRCLSEITQAARDSTKPLIYIVPEQFTLESERLLCDFSPSGAITLPQVLSFQRLSYHTFSKTGKLAGKLLDEVGKKMLLQKLLLRHRDELAFFAQTVERDGFIDSCDRAFREFAQYNVTPEELARRVAQVSQQDGGRGILGYKLADIARLYELFTAYISERYIITEQAANFVPDKLAASDFLTGCRVWIDGFTGFTAQEYGIIGGLFSKAEIVSVALCIEEPHTSYSNISENDPMSLMKQCVTRITELARLSGVPVLEPIRLTKKWRFEDSPDMAFLERRYLDYNVHTFDGVPHGISITGAPGVHAEAEQAAAEIIALVRGEGLRFADIALVCANPMAYEREIRAVFAAHDIPFFLDVRSDIALHPLTQLVCHAASVLAYDFRHEDVFAFLKTGLTPLNRDEIDLLENYAVKMGIRGGKWRAKTWTKGFENEYSEECLNDLRKRVVKALQPFAGKLKRGKSSPIRTYAACLFDMLEKLGIPDRTHDGEAVSFMQVLDKLTAILEKMVEIMGDEEVPPDGFEKILRIGVKSADLGIIPPTLDQVIIGSAERTRLPKIAALIVLGANDGILPAKKEEDAILTDSERATLSALGTQLAPDSRTQSLQGPFMMYGMLTQPERFLRLFYRTDSSDGQALKPSVIIERVRSLFPKAAEYLISDAEYHRPVTTAKAVFSRIGAALRQLRVGGSATDSETALLKYFRESPGFAERLLRLEQVSFEKTSRRFLSQKSIDMLYFSEMFSDISRLERYMQCPFAYFAHYNLRLRGRRRFAAGAPDYGSFYHEVLKDFGASLALHRLDWRELSVGQIDELTGQAVAKIAPQLANGVLLSTPRYEYIVGRMARIAKRSIWALTQHLRRGSFTPVASELGFGVNAAISGITIETGNGRKLMLQGRIDRVDIFDSGGKRYVKVIDYKSGGASFDISDIYLGTQLQLMTYLDIFMKTGHEYLSDVGGAAQPVPKMTPGGVLYFKLDDPILDEDKLRSGDVLEELLGKFKMTGLVLADDDVINAMDSGLTGRSNIVPVHIKTDGSFSSRGTKVADEEEFTRLRAAVTTKAAEIARRMSDGDIEVKPLAKPNGAVSCDYCGYANICHIEFSR